MTSQVKPTVTTIANWQGRIVTVCFAFMVGIGVVAAAFGSSMSPPARITSLAVAAFALTWSLYRGWRIGARFDDHGVTVRKFLRTDRFGWPEVSRFEDGRVAVDAGRRWAWALDIVLHDGRIITTPLGRPLKESTSPKTLSMVQQVAASHEIPAELTGQQTAPHDRPRIDDSQIRRPAQGPEVPIVVAERTPRWEAIIGTVICGGIAVFAPPYKFPHLVKHVPVPGVVAYLGLIAATTIWGCSRGWRMGVRMDDFGITVRNYFRTYRIGWPEVLRLADGAGPVPEGGRAGWALSVVLHGGQAVTASGTTRLAPRRETLTAIGHVAEVRAIPADLTGVATKRSFRVFYLAGAALLAVLSWIGGSSS